MYPEAHVEFPKIFSVNRKTSQNKVQHWKML